MSYCYVGNLLYKQWNYVGIKNDWNHSKEETDSFAEFKNHVDHCEECRVRQLRERDEDYKDSR